MSTSIPVAATPQSTLAELTRLSGRGFTVIRNIFVQTKVSGTWSGAALGRLVQARQPRALLAYLLLLMCSSAVARREHPLEAGVWARALSPAAPARPWAPQAMTRVWTTLDDFGLIEREREARLLRVKPRREDGRKEYDRPRPDKDSHRRELYFVLPDSFWLDRWHERLRLPGIAVLLILLYDTTGRDEVRLPYEDIQRWYGISAKTLQNGLQELRSNHLLNERSEWVDAPLSAIGRTQHIYYSLAGDFSRAHRKDLQERAARETRAREQKRAKQAKRQAKA